MRPPICEICHKDFRQEVNKGGTIQFKLSSEEEAVNDRMRQGKQVGHPKGLKWFCNNHLKIAEQYKHLSWQEARPRIIKNSKGWIKYWFLFQGIWR